VSSGSSDPWGKAPRVGQHCSWLPHGCHFRNSGLDRFRHTPILLPASPALRRKRSTLTSPALTPPLLPSRQHHQALGFAIHSHQWQVNAAGSRQIAAYQRIGRRRAAPDQRIATSDASQCFSQPGGLPFVVGETRGLVSNGTSKAAPHGNAARVWVERLPLHPFPVSAASGFCVFSVGWSRAEAPMRPV
jgi:hypothetical protein